MFFGSADLHYSGINLVSRERLDPLIGFVAWCSGQELSQTSYLLLQLVIFALGMFFLTRFVGGRSFQALLTALSAVVALLFVFGPDPFLFDIQWLPFSLLLLTRLYQTRRSSLVLPSAVSLAVVVWTVGALAPLVLLVSVPIVVCLARMTEDGQGDAGRDVACVLLFGFFVVAVGVIPEYTMPDYPTQARLTEISPLNYQLRPLLGPFLLPNPVVFTELLAWNMGHSYRMGVVLACLLPVLLGLRREDRSWQGAVVLLIALLIVVFDAMLEPQFREYSPYQILRRIIPGVALVDLPASILPLAVVFGLPVLLSGVDERRGLLLFTLLVGVIVSIDVFIPNNHIARSGLSTVDHFRIQKELRSRDVLTQVRHSPSSIVLATQGSWVAQPGIAERRDFAVLKRVPIKADLSANPANSEIAKAVDNNYSTRWSTARPQRAGDFVELDFHAKEKIARVVLSTKGAPTDFPRGIKVERSLGDSPFSEVMRQPVWLGPVRWAGGFPYFGPQSEVILDFPREIAANKLRFTLLDGDSRFDWSVVEIKLYREN